MDKVSELFSAIEPYLFRLVVLLLVAVMAFFGYRHFMNNQAAASLGGARVVVFDVVKLANAQRRLAATFIGRNPDSAGEDGMILMEMKGRTAEVLRDVAGPGTIILVKQAVVHSPLPDITDDVLRALKLPVDVPTQDTAGTGMDFAPTVLGLTPPPKAYLEKRGVQNPLSSNSGSVLP